MCNGIVGTGGIPLCRATEKTGRQGTRACPRGSTGQKLKLCPSSRQNLRELAWKGTKHIIAENCPNLGKHMSLQFLESKWTSNRINVNSCAPRRIYVSAENERQRAESWKQAMGNDLWLTGKHLWLIGKHLSGFLSDAAEVRKKRHKIVQGLREKNSQPSMFSVQWMYSSEIKGKKLKF